MGRDDMPKWHQILHRRFEAKKRRRSRVALIAIHHRCPLARAHRRGAGIGQQIDQHIFRLKPKQVVVRGGQQFVALGAGGHSNRLNGFDTEGFDDRLQGSYFLPRSCSTNRGDAPRLPASWPAALSALIDFIIGVGSHRQQGKPIASCASRFHANPECYEGSSRDPAKDSKGGLRTSNPGHRTIDIFVGEPGFDPRSPETRSREKQRKHAKRPAAYLILVAAAAIALTTGCNSVKPENAADTIYTGGNIITVNDSQPTAEAVAIKDGKILMVGTTAEVENMHKAANTNVVNLAGKTLVPGFIDAHSHFLFALDMPTQANLSAPPVGPVKSIPDIIAALKDLATEAEHPERRLGRGLGLRRQLARRGSRDQPRRPRRCQPQTIQWHPHSRLDSTAPCSTPSPSKSSTSLRKHRRRPEESSFASPARWEPAGLLMETAYLPLMSQMPQPSLEERAQAHGRRPADLYERRLHHHARGRDPPQRPRVSQEGRRAKTALHRPCLAAHLSGLRQHHQGISRLRLGKLRQSPEAWWRQDSLGWLAAGQDRFLHQAISDRRTLRGEKLARRTDTL